MTAAWRQHPEYLFASIIVHVVFIVLFAISFHWTSRNVMLLPPSVKVRIVEEKPREEPALPPQANELPKPTAAEEAASKKQQQLQKERERQIQIENQKKVILEKEREKLRQKAAEEKRRALEQQQEQAKRDKAFKERIAQEKHQLDEENRRLAAQRAEEERKLEEQAALARQADLKRKMTLIDKYKAYIYQKVRQNWFYQSSFKNKLCVMRIKMLPTGDVVNVTLEQSSGDQVFDTSVLHAIQRSSPLPMPPQETGLVNEFRDIRFEFGDKP